MSFETYMSLDGLLESVESGALAPLRGSFVVEEMTAGRRIERRQDLPPHAHWTAKELRELAAKLGDRWGALFVALSYRCAPLMHPHHAPRASGLRSDAHLGLSAGG